MPKNYSELSKIRRNQAFQAELKEIPGIQDVLLSLDIPYCLASSGDVEKIHTTLGITGLLHFFEGKIFSSQMVKRGKPFPDLFLQTRENIDQRIFTKMIKNFFCREIRNSK